MLLTKVTWRGPRDQQGGDRTACSNRTNSLLCNQCLWQWSAALLVALVVIGNLAYFTLIHPGGLHLDSNDLGPCSSCVGRHRP